MHRLIFIYNARKSRLANIPGAAQKLLTGKSDCELCTITHHAVQEKRTWAAFAASLDPPPAFYHRDDLPETVAAFLHDARVELPVVLEDRDGSYAVRVRKEALASCNGDEQRLITLLRATR